MKYFDLHCDTLLDCYDTRQPLLHNNLHISLDAAQKYEQYTQLLGIFSRTSLSDDEAFDKFLKVCAYFRTLELPDNFRPILAVEGANLTGGQLERVDRIHKEGVRFVALCVDSSDAGAPLPTNRRGDCGRFELFP